VSFDHLVQTQGIWAGVAFTLAVMYDRVQEKRLKEKDSYIARLEDEARKALAAKDMENAEYKRIALLALDPTKGTPR